MRWRDALARPAQALTIVVASCSLWGWIASTQAQEQAAAEQGLEILARGPIHEAFVSPLEDTLQPTTVVANEPPAPIDEIPPAVRPEDSLWAPGYWFWSAADNDYIWVSGVWRVPPPGQRWIPGYWEPTAGGVRWVSGFWASAEITQVDYLPPPPESLDRGPTSASPGANYFWLSGYWVYVDNDYRWQPGYWTQAYDNWIWMPAHYCWTPRGVVFINGYWDYPIDYRGVAFCPVRFHSPFYAAPGYRFTPTAAIRSHNLLLHMFVGPRWNHYFYGNFYGDVAVQAGLRPWFQYDRDYGHPLLSYYSWHFGRQNISYRSRLDNWYTYNQRFEDRRPPVRFADQQRLAAQGNADANFAVLTSPLVDFRGLSNLSPLDQDQITVFSRFSNELRSLAQQRASIEVKNEATASADARPFLDLPAVDRNLLPLLGRQPGSRTRVLRPDIDDPNLRQPGDLRRPGDLNQPALDPRDLGRPGLNIPGRVPGDELRGPVDREAFTPGGDPNRNTPDLKRPDINVPGQGQTPRGDRPGISVPGRVETPRGIGPGSNVPDIRSPVGEGGLDDQNRPDLKQPDMRRPDVNLPGRGQTPQGLRPGVSVPGRVESPRGPGPGGLSTPNIDRPDTGPTRDIPSGPDINLPDLRRPDVNVPGQGQTPRGGRPGVTVPGRAETPGAYSPSTNLDIPEVDSNSAVPGRNDLQPADRPEVNQPGRMEPPRGYVPGRDVPGLPRSNVYRPGITEVPGDSGATNEGQRPAQTPMPRADVPRGTDLPTVTPNGRSEMPQLMPRPDATKPAARGDDRSMFRGTNPGQMPPAVSPEGTTPRVNPGTNLNPRGTPGENRGQLNPNPRTPGSDRGGATRLPGGNALPGGISPNPGGNNPHPGGITPPGSGTPKAGNSNVPAGGGGSTSNGSGNPGAAAGTGSASGGAAAGSGGTSGGGGK